jgi:nucleoside diphosphate kinase
MQSAFVFAKPHANTPAVVELIKQKFDEVGITITSEGDINGKEIDDNKFIDQHYYAIASKATILTPDQLNIPADKFKEQFGEEWSTVLAEGRAMNALDASKHLDLDANQFEKVWGEVKKAKKMIKFGGGFYCGFVEIEGKSPIYTFNAFFMSMRTKFTDPNVSIHYFTVEFDPKKLSWADFRGKVLGPTDPADAPAESLRGMIAKDWQALGLKAECNTGDNAVHASASPFEALAEKSNWLKQSIADDAFGKALIDAGVSEAMIKDWSVDPQVVLPGEDGKKGSLFDQLEDMDLEECIAKSVEISKAQ